MGMEDRDYLHGHRARREREFNASNTYSKPKEFRQSTTREIPPRPKTKTHIPSDGPPPLADVLTQPAVAWSLGLALGVILGVVGTAIIAVTDIELLSLPLNWAYGVVSWFK